MVGNEAGDLDSVVSAVGLARALRSRFEREDESVVVVAVLPFAREDAALRQDVAWAFETSGWELEAETRAPVALADVDELGKWSGLAAHGLKVSVALVDHNKWGAPHLAERWRAAAPPRVVAVVDHHRDEKMHQDAELRVVDEAAGSASSLVALQCAKDIPPDLANLLKLTILMDTRNFSAERTSSADVQAASLLGFGPETASTNTPLFKTIKHKREDVSGLSIKDLLRVDYKQIDLAAEAPGSPHFLAGFSSIPVPYSAFTAKGGSAAVEAAVTDFTRTKSLGLFVGLCSAESVGEGSPPQRGLLLRSGDDALLASLTSQLEAAPPALPPALAQLPLFQTQGIVEHGFGLVRASPHHANFLRGSITRKTLLPFVVEVMKKTMLKL